MSEQTKHAAVPYFVGGANPVQVSEEFMSHLDRYRTCRVCKEGADNLVKYGTRHYVHADCAMKKWGGEFFQRLTPWQASQFPYLSAVAVGAENALKQRARAKGEA